MKLEDSEVRVYRVCEYNVTRYEMGDALVDQGFLLKLISERDLLNMSDAETEAIENCLFLKNWMKAKVDKNRLMVRVLNNAGYLFTFVFGCYVSLLAYQVSVQPLENIYWHLYSSDSWNDKTCNTTQTINGSNMLDCSKQQNVIKEMENECPNLNVSSYFVYTQAMDRRLYFLRLGILGGRFGPR